MKVSVIIPSYNHAKFVTGAVESVLNQTYRNVELIAIDDGSKDGSPEIIKTLAEKHGFRYLCKTNEGICKTLNLGLSMASGDLICFLASDDLMPPQRLSEQVKMMQQMPDADVIAGASAIMDDDGKILGHKHPKYLGYLNFAQMLKRNRVFAPTAILRSRVFAQYGTYDPKMVMEDFYMWLKLLSHGGRIYNTDKIWANYRISAFDLERRIRWYYAGFVQTLTPYLPDPRVAQGIASYEKTYALKMAFCSGLDFFRAERDLLHKFGWPFRAVLLGIGLIPQGLRRKILLYLMRNS